VSVALVVLVVYAEVGVVSECGLSGSVMVVEAGGLESVPTIVPVSVNTGVPVPLDSVST